MTVRRWLSLLLALGAVVVRFRRSRDAERERDEVDLEVLGAAITDVIARSVAPATTGLWLRQGSTR